MARFLEKVIEHKLGVCFSLQLLSQIFLILRRTEKDVIINVPMSSLLSTHYSCQILMKLELS